VKNQILLAIGLYDNPTDVGALIPMIEAAEANRQAVQIQQTIRAWLADNGYASTANFHALADRMLLVAVAKEAKQTGRDTSSAPSTPRGWQKMAARLATPPGAASTSAAPRSWNRPSRSYSSGLDAT
jgi:hypothetical protein